MRTLITIFVALVGLATTNAAKTLQVAVVSHLLWIP